MTPVSLFFFWGKELGSRGRKVVENFLLFAHFKPYPLLPHQTIKLNI